MAHRLFNVRRMAVPLALLALIVLAGCGDGADVGRIELVGDEAAYPGVGGPTVGVVTRNQDEAEAVWRTVGFPGDPPSLNGAGLVVVAGGESGSCPWRLTDVIVDDGVVWVDLGDPSDVACTDDWNPRALAITVPGEVLADASTVTVIHYGTEQPVAPFPGEGASGRWESGSLPPDELGPAAGCADATIYATGPVDEVVVIVTWHGAASRGVAAGGLDEEVLLPHSDVRVELQFGSHLSDGLCTDVIMLDRPLISEAWLAVSGHASITIEPLPEATEDWPLARATVILRSIDLERMDAHSDGRWHIDHLELRDAEVGWYPG